MRTLSFSGILLMMLSLAPSAQSQTFTDVEGNTYKTVRIGDQIWMAENLRVTKFKDGSAIQLVSDEEEWWEAVSRREPAYAFLNFNAANKSYGLIYNRYAVDNFRKDIAPAGWKVPEPSDFGGLRTYLKAQTDEELDAANAPQSGKNIYYSEKAPQCSSAQNAYDCVLSSKLRSGSGWESNGKDIYATNSTGFNAKPFSTLNVEYRMSTVYDEETYERIGTEESISHRWNEGSTGWWMVGDGVFRSGGGDWDSVDDHVIPTLDSSRFGTFLRQDAYYASGVSRTSHGLYIRLVKE